MVHIEHAPMCHFAECRVTGIMQPQGMQNLQTQV